MQIKASLKEEAVDMQQISTDLRIVSVGVKKEMTEAKTPLPSKTKLDQLRPFTQATVKSLGELSSVLELSASPIVTPYSKNVPVVSP